MTQIIYGSELSAELKENMRSKVESWVSAGMRTPCLAVILVGDNPQFVCPQVLHKKNWNK